MKPKTEVINLRIDSRLKAALDTIAAEEERTLSGQIRVALWEWYKASQYYNQPIDIQGQPEVNNGI
jgi:hypothetical protein